MTGIVSPSPLGSVLEYTRFSLSGNVIDDGVISITSIRCRGNQPLVSIQFSGQTFTVRGEFRDAFQNINIQYIDYIDGKEDTTSVYTNTNRFSSVPLKNSGYKDTIKFTPDPNRKYDQYFDLTYTKTVTIESGESAGGESGSSTQIITTTHNLQFYIEVLNDYSVGRKLLNALIDRDR